MTDWFRSWHGAPSDPKWRTIARRANVRPGDVAAVVWLLLDRASQAAERGSIEGYDAEVLADALGYEPEEVERVIAALRDKSVLVNNRFTGWDKHQPQREDGSSERAKAWRERQKSAANAPERNQTQVTARVDTEEDTERRETSSHSGEPRCADAKAGEGEVRFHEFQEGFPGHVGIAFQPAMLVWERLTADDRRAAVAALPAFSEHIKTKPSTRPMAPKTYLLERRWEGFKRAVAAAKERHDARVFVAFGTPAWDAWSSHLRAKGKGMFSPCSLGGRNGWMFDTEFPPQASQEHAA
jgi:hypothetical protein